MCNYHVSGDCHHSECWVVLEDQWTHYEGECEALKRAIGHPEADWANWSENDHEHYKIEPKCNWIENSGDCTEEVSAMAPDAGIMNCNYHESGDTCSDERMCWAHIEDAANYYDGECHALECLLMGTIDQ